jgi:transposase
MTVKISRLEHDAAALRAAAAASSDAKVTRRVLAIALVLEGRPRTEAAQTCGMDRQILRDWVIRYNERGIDGLSDQRGGGRPPKLEKAEKAQLAKWVRQGPDPEDGLVRWRLSDLRRRLMDRCFVIMDERSISRILRTLSFSHISVRPRHPQADTEAQEAHKKTLPPWSTPQSRPQRGTDPSSSGGRMKPGSASKAA